MRVVRHGAPFTPPQFTGTVKRSVLLEVPHASDVRIQHVTFEAGSRTYWHSHRGEQMLYVVEGNGCIQKWGENPYSIKPGDIVYVAPGEKHWHGQGPGEGLPPFVHIAFNIGETDWMEQVADAEACQDSVS